MSVKVSPKGGSPGIGTGAGGRTGLASYYLGTAFHLRRNPRMALYHLEKARQSSELSPRQQEKADELIKENKEPKKKRASEE